MISLAYEPETAHVHTPSLAEKNREQTALLTHHAGQGYSGKLVPRLLGRGTNVQQARHHHADVALPRAHQH
jgi:hypothetical protein